MARPLILAFNLAEAEATAHKLGLGQNWNYLNHERRLYGLWKPVVYCTERAALRYEWPVIWDRLLLVKAEIRDVLEKPPSLSKAVQIMAAGASPWWQSYDEIPF